MCKRTAKNVKSYLVATIRDEARNAFLPLPFGRRVLGEKECPSSNHCPGKDQQGWGKQSPETAIDGTTASKHLAIAHLTIINSRGMYWVDKCLLFV